jgi:protein involved in polysaccharide export with SLBB domain
MVPGWDLYRYVYVHGEVKAPGSFPVKKGERLSSLIERAGGLTENAYPRGAVLTRQSAKEAQQKRILEMVNRLERELATTTLSDFEQAEDEKEAKYLELRNKEKAIFLDSLRLIEPSGRLVISLDDPQKLIGTEQDITLENGDVLMVPANPEAVQVVGAVYNAGSYVYSPGMDVNYYINLSGGCTDGADKKHIYVAKVDGSAYRSGGGLAWNRGSRRWDDGGSGVLESGDTVVVPDKLDKIGWLRHTKDVAQILFQIMTSSRILLLR